MARRIGWAALLAAGLLLPMRVYPVLAADILAWALFATAFDIMLGYTGLLSFGQAAFFGGGAYTAGLLTQRLGVPYPLNALAAALAAGLLALPLMGADLIITTFAIVVIGGMGSILGSVVTGFFVGVLSALGAVYYPPAANTLVFIVMAIVLLFRPSGLFGSPEAG